jgi:amidohydrolase
VLRADTDALPVDEKNSIACKSTRPGIMHACGHDMHTAALVGAAKALLRLRHLWKGTVVVLFQPSEEKEPGGALPMIAEKAFPENAAAVFGLHVSSEHSTGQVGLKAGSECSGELVFDVLVKGKGGHGAAPHATVDPIVCASSMILDLQTLISRECPAVEPAVLTVGAIHSGTKHNIIPDEAVFLGTIRTFSVSLQRLLKKRVAQCLATTARSFRAQVETIFHDSYPAGFNDPALAARAQEVLTAFLGKRNVVVRKYPTMFSEDFTYYQQKVPGLYLHLGVRRPGLKKMPGIHSATFLPDERALQTAMTVHTALCIDMLGAAGTTA